MTIKNSYKLKNGLVYKKVDSPSFQLFDFDRFVPSVDRLSIPLVANGMTTYPSIYLNGKDAYPSGWVLTGYRNVTTTRWLTLQNGTSPTYNDGSPLFSDSDNSVLFNAGGYYKAGNTTFGNITTEDICIELIFKYRKQQNFIMSKRTAPGPGLELLQWDSGAMVAILGAPAYIDHSSNTDNIHLTWNHAMWFCNRDEASTNGAQWYINGKASGSGKNMSSANTTQASSVEFCIGGRWGGTYLYNSNIALFSIYLKSSWFKSGSDGPTEWATIAQERFSQLTQTYPIQARGTYLPAILSRNCPAYLDKFEYNGTRKLYYVGNNWPRVCEWPESSGSKRLKGYLSERTVTNIITYSENFNSWTKYNSTVPTDSVLVPDGRTLTTSTFQESTDVSNVYHYVALMQTWETNVYCFSVFLKPLSGGRDTCLLQFGSMGGIIVNISTGAMSNPGSQTLTYGYIPYSDGWKRFYVSASRTPASQSMYIYSNGASTYKGDGRKCFLMFGAQLEKGEYYPSSLIRTGGSITTRLADTLRYVGNDGNLGDKNSLIFDVLAPNYTTMSGLSLIETNSGGSSADSVRAIINTDDRVSVSVSKSGYSTVTATTTKDITDGNIHNISVRYDHDLYVKSDNSTSVSGSISIPVNQDRIEVGMDGSSVLQPNCLISNIRVYKNYLTRV